MTTQQIERTAMKTKDAVKGMLHAALHHVTVRHDVGLRTLARALHEKADEIERIAPPDWQVVADAAYSMDAHPRTIDVRAHLEEIYDAFKGAETPDKYGFEAWALSRLVDMLLRVMNSSADLSKVNRQKIREMGGNPDDQIPF